MSTVLSKWEVSPEFPDGRLVELTPEEQAQYDLDQQAGSAAAEAAALVTTNRVTLEGRVGDAIAALEDAAASWDTLTAGQKDTVLRLTVRVTVRLARLCINRLDAAP